MGNSRRADRRTGGMIPELDRPPDQRRAVNVPPRPWTDVQSALMVGAVISCQSKKAYDLMLPHMLKCIGHEPKYPETSNPDTRTHLDNCNRTVELRIVSKMLGAYDGWRPPEFFSLFFMHRQYMPERLYWGERVKILKPWYKRDESGMSCISLGEVSSRMLGRAEVDPLVNDYLKIQEKRTPYQETEERAGKAPVRPVSARLFATINELEMLRTKGNANKKDEVKLILDIWKYLRGTDSWPG